VVEFSEGAGARFGIVSLAAVPGRVLVKHSSVYTGTHDPAALRLVHAAIGRRDRVDLPAGHPDAVPQAAYRTALARLPSGPRVRHERRVVFEGTPERVARQIALSVVAPFRMATPDMVVTVECVAEVACAPDEGAPDATASSASITTPEHDNGLSAYTRPPPSRPFEIGQTYMTLSGVPVEIISAHGEPAIATVLGSDGIHRYNRDQDRGRVTGASFDLTAEPLNLVPVYLEAAS
jgi:hypothetical protein